MMNHLVVLIGVTALSLLSPVASDKPQFKPEAAEKVSWKFKEKPRSGTDVSVVSLDWEPSSMIETPGGLTKENFGVEIQSGAGPFTAVEIEPRLKGGKYSYDINIVPCEEQHIRFLAKNEDGTSYLDLPEIIPASSNQEIASSSFVLSSVKEGRVERIDGQFTITWSPSKCASSYLVVLEGSNATVEKEVLDATSLELNLSDLTEECGQYEVTVFSELEGKYSSPYYVDTVTTPPAISAVDMLKVETFPTQHSLVAKWNGYESMPCVSKYSVAICTEDDCGESVSKTLDDSLAYVEFSSDATLDECSAYTLVIKPEYDGQELQEKRVSFLTKSPGIADISSLLSPVSAVMSSDQQVLVTWLQVKCASEYHVYQQVVTSSPATDSWEKVATSTTSSATIHGVPCTKYIYGVRAVTNGEESEIVKAVEEPIMIPLNKEDPYSATGLKLSPTTSSLGLTWEHASCVQSYRIRVCPDHGEDENCQEEMLTPEDPSSTHVTGELQGLSPCTDYNLHIFATTGDQEIQQAAVSQFQTEAPTPEAPENLTLIEDPVSQTLQLSFTPQECATQYKVYEVLDQDESSLQLKTVTETTEVTMDIPPPCTDFKFAVSAIVGDTEGPKTEFIGEKVPPRNGVESTPSLHIDQTYNTTVELQLLSPDFNKKCEVESYEVKYQNLGEDEVLQETILRTDLSDGRIIIDNFPQTVENGMKIEGRIKYLGYSWSPWISSQSEVPDARVQEGNGMMVPIVIGALVALVILLAVIFFVVRRKKMSQNKYNCDKGDKSESKKLNDEGEV